MDNNNIHIDKLIKEKIEQFSPAPPDHIWAGIEKGIRVDKSNQFFRRRWFIAAAIIVLFGLIATLLFIEPISFGTSDSVTEKAVNNETDNSSTQSNLEYSLDNEKDNIKISEDIEDTEIEKSPISEVHISGISNTNAEIKSEIVQKRKSIKITEQHNQYEISSIDIIETRRSSYLYDGVNSEDYQPENRETEFPPPEELSIEPSNDLSYQRWKTSYYITPELSISHFDSVEILNSYSLNIEPTYFLNENWFLRFGGGLSFVRDRGFARIKYITTEYMGSYNDVYDITFDTVQGNVTPVYHTKSVEVWDSVPHVSVSGVTNKYLYLQVPTLFGYQYSKPGSMISWYFMGGPAVNVKVGSWIDNPKPEDENSDIVDLQNNLPVRSDIYFQLWFGAGLEYEINNKISVAIEPGYRYYFKSIYNNPYNHTSSSGFTLRVGLVYLMK